MTEPDGTTATPRRILQAASEHDIPALRALLRIYPGGSRAGTAVRDPLSGFTPLHVAIESGHSQAVVVNGDQNGTAGEVGVDMGSDKQTGSEGQTIAVVKFLLQNGAIWNDTDLAGETPGCVALRYGLRGVYEVMVDAGVRAELLLNRLDEYERMQDEEDEEVVDEEVVDGENEQGTQGPEVDDTQSKEDVDVDVDVETKTEMEAEDHDQVPNDVYLDSTLRFQDGRILDGDANGVMMAWETDIMRQSVDKICPRAGLKVLNIGHGMGIADTFIQAKAPTAHHIIEAHPAVLQRMRLDGWDQKDNVTIHEGRWQDVLPKILASADIIFDAIYFDTFAEDYSAFRDFFSDFVVGLLDEQGRWSFFNGMGADRQICYDVYQKVVEMDLCEAGYDVDWERIAIGKTEEQEWKGVKRKYWILKEYKLPTCTFNK